MLLALAVSAVLGPAQAAVPPAYDTTLDFLKGDWEIYDASSGARVGESHVEVQAPGSMLLETRAVDGEPQPLWWENSERDGGWIQLFVAPQGKVRAFTPVSKPGEWPIVIGGGFVLRDGTPARFRVTMPKPDGGHSRRTLEMSRDEGKSWSVVFDYDYRKKGG